MCAGAGEGKIFIIYDLLNVQSMMTLGRMACATDATMTEVCTCNDMDNCNAGPSLNIYIFYQHLTDLQKSTMKGPLLVSYFKSHEIWRSTFFRLFHVLRENLWWVH
jgi:hypothetical protein